MTGGQILIAKWKKIEKALDCRSKKTAKKKCALLGIHVRYISGVAHVDAEEVRQKFKQAPLQAPSKKIDMKKVGK